MGEANPAMTLEVRMRVHAWPLRPSAVLFPVLDHSPPPDPTNRLCGPPRAA
jgi:hypothetical protein